MRKPKPTTLAFAGLASLVIVVSVLLTLRRGNAATRPDPPRFSGSVVVQRMPSLLADPRLPSAVAVAVVRDEAAARYYGSPATLDSVVAAWREALAGVGARARVLSSTEAKRERSARVLVVPSSPCLTIATSEAIENAISRGAGVILTGPTGTHDATCQPLGFGLIVRVSGAARAEPLEERPMVYVTLAPGNPMTLDIPPGARLDLDPAPQVALRHAQRDGFYSDYTLDALPARGQPLLDAAIAHATLGRAHTVFWGFELRDAVRRPWSQSVLRLLVRNSVAWAAGVPLAEVEPWPRGRRAAAAFAQDVESQFTNAQYAVDSLGAAHVRSTFFLTSQLAAQHERLARSLARAGEVGTHSENHRLLGGLPADVQRDRLAITQRDLMAMFGLPVQGLRPPEEQFDEATMAGWLAEGGRYLFGANDSRAAAPELLRVGRDTLVLLGRIANDDYTALAERRRTPESIAELFLGDYAHLRSLGGMYVLSYHSHLLARPELVPALARTARAVAADTSVWLATTGEIAEWWRERADLAVQVRMRGADRMDLVVRNRGRRLARGAVLRVVVPDGRRAIRAQGVLLPSAAGVVRLFVTPVPPYATRTFMVRFDEPPAPRRSPRAGEGGWHGFLRWLQAKH